MGKKIFSLRKILIATSILSTTTFAVLAASDKPSNAYSVTGNGSINLHKVLDFNRQLDPIKSAAAGHDFKARLTLNKGPRLSKFGNYIARFNINVVNNSDKTLTHLKINGRRYKFNPNSPAMGLVQGETYNQNRWIKIANYTGNHDQDFDLKGIKSGWWTHSNGDYEKESVPEPLTIFGTAAALGFGAMFKKHKKKGKKEVKVS